MPMYASEILELVQTLLDRTLERCRAVYTEVSDDNGSMESL
jgi:exocyst complex component 4